MGKKRKRKPRPVCRQHWKNIRKEALGTVPIWSRPMAMLRIRSWLEEKGFVLSTTECTYCDSGNTTDSQ